MFKTNGTFVSRGIYCSLGIKCVIVVSVRKIWQGCKSSKLRTFKSYEKSKMRPKNSLKVRISACPNL